MKEKMLEIGFNMAGFEIFVGRQFGDQGLCGSRQMPFIVTKTNKNDYKSGLKIRMFCA